MIDDDVRAHRQPRAPGRCDRGRGPARRAGAWRLNHRRARTGSGGGRLWLRASCRAAYPEPCDRRGLGAQAQARSRFGAWRRRRAFWTACITLVRIDPGGEQVTSPSGCPRRWRARRRLVARALMSARANATMIGDHLARTRHVATCALARVASAALGRDRRGFGRAWYAFRPTTAPMRAASRSRRTARRSRPGVSVAAERCSRCRGSSRARCSTSSCQRGSAARCGSLTPIGPRRRSLPATSRGSRWLVTGRRRPGVLLVGLVAALRIVHRVGTLALAGRRRDPLRDRGLVWITSLRGFAGMTVATLVPRVAK